MTRFARSLIALVAVGGLLLAACGDDDDASVDGDASADVDGGELDADADADVDVDIPASANLFAEGECLQTALAFTQAMGGYGQALSSAFSGGTGENPADALAQYEGALEEMAAVAPSELQADLELFAQIFGQYASALAEIDFSQAQSNPQAMAAEFEALQEQIDTDAFEAAADNIGNWFDANCDQG